MRAARVTVLPYHPTPLPTLRKRGDHRHPAAGPLQSRQRPPRLSPEPPMPRPHVILPVALLLLAAPAAPAQKEYGFDNRKPSGQPYLDPEETVRRMKVADGFEVKLF